MPGLSFASELSGDEKTLPAEVLYNASGRVLSESDLSLKGP